MRQLVCADCREKSPSLLSCIHTFGPRSHKSSILSEGTAIPGVIPDPEGDNKRFNPALVEQSLISMPSNRRLDLPEGYEDRMLANPDSDDESR